MGSVKNRRVSYIHLQQGKERKKEAKKKGKMFTYEITYKGGYNVYGAGKGVIVRLATSGKNPQFTF